MGSTSKLLGLMIITVFVLTIAQNVAAADQNGLYTCWGGCINKCFLLQSPEGPYPCYFQCLPGCFSLPAANAIPEKHFYCKVGCSAQLCIPFSSDAAKMKRCLGNCGNVCRA